MFKLHKFLSLTIISITPIPACFFSITSCSNYAVGPDYKSSYADFINTRTFSILSNNNDKSHVGTGWIFRKSCKSLYTYYLATNVHVAALFSVSGSEIPMQLAYNPDYSIRTCFQPESYFKVESYVLLGENSDNRPTKSNWNQNSKYEWDVDFDVFEINFGSEDQDITKIDPFCKYSNNLLHRLNYLNEYAATHDNKVLEFANSNYHYYSGMPLHVAGFPARPMEGYKWKEPPQWTSYATTYSRGVFNYDTTNNPIFSEDQGIEFKDGKPINIIGKAVWYRPATTPELTGGSSGSMVIDNDDKVVAINFAGIAASKDADTSIQNLALFLNTKNSYFGTEYRYEVFDDWFSELP